MAHTLLQETETKVGIFFQKIFMVCIYHGIQKRGDLFPGAYGHLQKVICPFRLMFIYLPMFVNVYFMFNHVLFFSYLLRRRYILYIMCIRV